MVFEGATKSSLGKIAGLTMAIVGATFAVTNELVITPLRDEIARLDRDNQGLQRELEKRGPGEGDATREAESNPRRFEPSPAEQEATSSESTRRGFSEAVDSSQDRFLEEVEGEGFTFSLRECVSSRSTVRCSFSVKNNGEDKTLHLYANARSGNTRIFDNFGNEYSAFQTSLGNRQGIDVNRMMITRLPVEASFSFQGISPDATGISVLEVTYRASGPSGGRMVSREGSFKIRDIALSKEE